MTEPRTQVESIYTMDDGRLVTHSIRVGPDDTSIGAVEIKGVSSINWDFSVGLVPTCTIETRDLFMVIANWVGFFTNIWVEVGFDGVNLPVFVGRVFDVRDSDRGLQIQCSGSSWPLDEHFHEEIITLNNVQTGTALNTLFDTAKIVDRDIEVAAWTIGTVVPQTITFQSYGEAVNKILEIGGGAWWEMPIGFIKARDLYVRDSFTGGTAALEYWAFDHEGPNEIQPAGYAGRPRLRGYQSVTAVRAVKNGCVVRGATYQVDDGNGGQTSFDVEGSDQQPSNYVRYADGSQAYNDELLSNELIDIIAKANEVAQRVVTFKNGLPRTITAQIDGDPRLFLTAVARFVDRKKSFDRLGAVMSYSGRLVAAGGFVCDVTALRLDNEGSTNQKPVAAATYNLARLVRDDAVKEFMTLHSHAVDRDGDGITEWSWAISEIGLNETMDTGQELVFPVSDHEDTLTIVHGCLDDGGLSDTMSIEVNNIAPRRHIYTPHVWFATPDLLAVSTGPATSWLEAEPPATPTAVAALPDVNLPGGPSPGMLYGREDGGIDFWNGSAAPDAVMLPAGSPIIAIEPDRNRAGVIWALSADGRHYRSANGGFAWTRCGSIPARLGRPSMILNGLYTAPGAGPGGDAVWAFGSDAGRPVVVYDPHGTNEWAELHIGGLLGGLLRAAPDDATIKVTGMAMRPATSMVLVLDSDDPAWNEPIWGALNVWDSSNWGTHTDGSWPSRRARFVTHDFEPGHFVVGWADSEIITRLNFAGLDSDIVASDSVSLDTGVFPTHVFPVCDLIPEFGGMHIIAANDGVNGYVYVVGGRLRNIGLVRPGDFGDPMGPLAGLGVSLGVVD